MQNETKKVAIINSVLDYGSTGTLARGLYEFGKTNGYDPFVFYGRGEKKSGNNIFRIESPLEVYIHKSLTLLTGNQGGYSVAATKRMVSMFEKENIRNFILLCIHGYYLNETILMKYLRNHSDKVVFVTSDEYAGVGKCCFNGGCIKYQTECSDCPQIRSYPKSLFFDKSGTIFKRKKEYYDGFDNICFVGPRTNIEVFRRSALIKNKTSMEIDWGIDLDRYKYSYNEKLYEKYNIPKNRIYILVVAKYSDSRKGVSQFFFPLAKKMEGSRFHFVNVGYDGRLGKDDIPSNVTLIDYISDQDELSELYSLCDYYLCTSIEETQPIACLISVACGTPVLCFNTSGLRSIGDGESAAIKYIDAMNIEAMAATLSGLNKKDDDIMNTCRAYAEKRFSRNMFNKKIYELIG